MNRDVKIKKITFSVIAIPMYFALFAGAAFAQNGNSNGNGASNGSPFQQFQNQIDALQAQIDVLQAASSNDPIALDVDCDGGETIGAALASVADTHPLLRGSMKRLPIHLD